LVLSKSGFPSSFPAFPSRNFLFLFASSPSTSLRIDGWAPERGFRTCGDGRSSDSDGWDMLYGGDATHADS
jgi:hypothetical protein